jgi:tetratricopeptide (TPR) repeat protein
MISLIIINTDILLSFVKYFPNENAWGTGRFIIWRTSFYSFMEKPLFGFGLGNFEIAYLKNQFPSLSILRYSETTGFAHNDFLQLLVCLGLFGAILILILCKAFIKDIDFKKTFETYLGRWAFSVILLHGINSLFNFSFYSLINILVFSFCLSILVSKNSKSNENSTEKLSFSSLKISYLLFFLFFAITYSLSDFYSKKGDFQKALSIFPWRDDYWFERANQLSDSDDQKVAFIRKSLEINPYDAFKWSRLGQLLGDQGKSMEAIQAFENALFLAPNHAPFHVYIGIEMLRSHSLSLAYQDFESAKILEPLSSNP